jgi:uncharacterized membrane protein (DUF4010 family)
MRHELMTGTELLGLFTALGCGLLIGIERERRKGSGPMRAFAGMRSFALVSMIGALTQALQPMLVVVGALLIATLCVISHLRHHTDDPGITTELALFLSFLLGVNALANPTISAGSAVVIAAMLNLRSPLHHFARVSLKTTELRDALVLAGAALVALPLLPDESSKWLLGVNPHRLWSLVIVLMTLQAVGHIALRITGPRLGLALSGLASGFVSSTATIAAMGTRCRNEPALLMPCVSGALMSNVATFIFLFVVTLTVAPGQLSKVALSLGAGLVCSLLVSSASLFRQRGGADFIHSIGHAFSLLQAITFALILSATTVAVAYANDYMGHAAVQFGAALAGLADVHAAAGSVLSLAETGTLGSSDTLLAILIVITSNTFSKMAAACLAGGFRFAARVVPGLMLILLAAWGPWLLGIGV